MIRGQDHQIFVPNYKNYGATCFFFIQHWWRRIFCVKILFEDQINDLRLLELTFFLNFQPRTSFVISENERFQLYNFHLIPIRSYRNYPKEWIHKNMFHFPSFSLLNFELLPWEMKNKIIHSTRRLTISSPQWIYFTSQRYFFHFYFLFIWSKQSTFPTPCPWWTSTIIIPRFFRNFTKRSKTT